MDVLVVDDEADIRKFVTRAIEKSGFRVRAVASGREAINTQRTHRAEVMVLDMKMPDLDGPATLAAIREFDRDLPVIALTAFRDDYEDEAQPYGVREWIAKPPAKLATKRRLLACIREACTEVRTRRVQRIVDEVCRQRQGAMPEDIEWAQKILDPTLDSPGGGQERTIALAQVAMISNALRGFSGEEKALEQLLILVGSTVPDLERTVATLAEGELAEIAEQYRSAYRQYSELMDDYHSHE